MRSFDEKDYFSTTEGQFIAGAYSYLRAARIVRYSDSWRVQPSVLFRPALHLVAHGVELLLKFPFVRRNGGDVEAVRSRFGHDLAALWAAPENATMRELVVADAEESWANAEASGQYPDDDFSDNPVEILERALTRLGELHGRNTDFALRYVVAPDAIGPRPSFLADTFGATAERVMKSPTLADR